MTTSDPHALDDIWINAINALARPSGRDQFTSDPEPIVQLLRSDTPMPPGARDLLAELFMPGDPPISDFTLIPKKLVRFGRLFLDLEAVQSFAERKAEGKSAEVAAEEAGKDHLVDGRTIHRYRERVAKLGRRLRGDDKPTKKS